MPRPQASIPTTATSPTGQSTDLSPIRPAWSYWSWRIGVPVAFAIYIAGFVYTFAARSVAAFFVTTLLLWPFALVTAFARLQTLAFGWDYSLFGRYRRTPLPDDSLLCRVSVSYAIIGRLRTGPIVAWLFYRRGIGIRIAVIGDVFLPLEEIDTIEVRRGAWGLMGEMSHHCPEVRGPIGVPNKIAEIMAHYYPEKVSVPTELA